MKTVFFFSALALCCSIAHAQRTDILRENFEGTSLVSGWRYDTMLTGSYSLVTPPTPFEGKCVRIKLNANQDLDGKARAELKSPDVGKNYGDERWYQFSMFVPSDWPVDQQKDIISQFYPGGGEGPAAIHWEIDGDRVYITKYYKSGGTTTNAQIVSNEPLSFYKGRWISFYLHARWSPFDDGYLKITRSESGRADANSTLVHRANGLPNTRATSTTTANFWKCGHYLGAGWAGSTNKTKDKIIYFDAILIQKPSDTTSLNSTSLNSTTSSRSTS